MIFCHEKKHEFGITRTYAFFATDSRVDFIRCIRGILRRITVTGLGQYAFFIHAFFMKINLVQHLISVFVAIFNHGKYLCIRGIIWLFTVAALFLSTFPLNLPS
jgi:hypothetical protein